jgi:hypothetical protein
MTTTTNHHLREAVAQLGQLEESVLVLELEEATRSLNAQICATAEQDLEAQAWDRSRDADWMVTHVLQMLEDSQPKEDHTPDSDCLSEIFTHTGDILQCENPYECYKKAKETNAVIATDTLCNYKAMWLRALFSEVFPPAVINKPTTVSRSSHNA